MAFHGTQYFRLWISGEYPVFGQISVQGIVPLTKGRFLKLEWINILDIFKSFLFCFNTFGARRYIDVLDPGLTEDVWHQKYENKKEGF